MLPVHATDDQPSAMHGKRPRRRCGPRWRRTPPPRAVVDLQHDASARDPNQPVTTFRLPSRLSLKRRIVSGSIRSPVSDSR